MDFITEIFVSLFLELNSAFNNPVITTVVYFALSFVAVYFIANKRFKNIQLSIIFNADLDKIQKTGKDSYLKTEDQNKLLIASGYSVFANILVWLVKFVLGWGFAIIFTSDLYSGPTNFLFNTPFNVTLLELINMGENSGLIILGIATLLLQVFLNVYVEKNVLVSNTGVDIALCLGTLLSFIYIPTGIIIYWLVITVLEIIAIILQSTVFWEKSFQKTRDSVDNQIKAYGLGVQFMSEDKKTYGKKNAKKNSGHKKKR